jgi:hypothetical protein
MRDFKSGWKVCGQRPQSGSPEYKRLLSTPSALIKFEFSYLPFISLFICGRDSSTIVMDGVRFLEGAVISGFAINESTLPPLPGVLFL